MDKQTHQQLKKEVEELRQLPGKQRGEHIKYSIDFVRKKEGEEAIEKIKNTLKEMDFDIGDVYKFSDTKWIPETITHIFIVAAARIFKWSEEDVFEMGKNLATRSTIFKIFMQYFTSVDKTVKQGVKRWKNNFTRGQLEVKELDKKNKKGTFVLRDFQTHPLICTLFQGFFKKILEIVTGNKKVEVKESKCMSDGYKYHEFPFKW